ncbi:MAG: CmpA/NrtA family ABC transporter substrate-binding protein [Rhodospirillales bacterium]
MNNIHAATGLHAPSRRDLLKAAALMPVGWAGAAYASDAPEQTDVNIGFVAVESCGSLVAAHEKGFFAKHGLKSTMTLQNGWAAARDKVISGENHASHLKYDQPLASTIGLLGAPKIPIVAPFTLSRSGSVFMVSTSMKGKLTFDPASWRAVLEERKAKNETFTIALPLPFGWHGLMYRYFLANAGINADKDMRLITLPPAQMVQNIRVGTMEACSMVEPWGNRGVADGITSIVMYGHEMWPNHPIKALGMRADWAEKNPRTTQAILRAVQEAATWCDNPENRPELARILSGPSYLNTPVKYILPTLLGQFDWGDGRKETAPAKGIGYANTVPQAREAKWHLTQFRRWGMTDGAPDYDGATQAVLRPDLHTQAMRDLGLPAPVQDLSPLTLWDGVTFDPAKPEAYATSFAINSLKGA